MSEKNSEGRDPKVVGTADNPVAGPEEVTKGELIAEGTGSASELASGPHAHLDRVLVPQAPTEGPVRHRIGLQAASARENRGLRALPRSARGDPSRRPPLAGRFRRADPPLPDPRG